MSGKMGTKKLFVILVACVLMPLLQSQADISILSPISNPDYDGD